MLYWAKQPVGEWGEELGKQRAFAKAAKWL
jgi:hypothetical protein